MDRSQQPARAGDDKLSLPEQEERGCEFLQALGRQVVAVYSVPGHSREYRLWSDIERGIPAYRELRLAGECQAFDVLHPTDVDRLGRASATYVVEQTSADEQAQDHPITLAHAVIPADSHQSLDLAP